MLSRKEQTENKILLPGKWQHEVQELLMETYKEQVLPLGKEFKVYGMTYPNELFIAVSLTHKEDQNAIPLTYTMSLDLEEKTNMDKSLEQLINSMGIFFDSYFNGPDETEYFSRWQEVQYNKIKFFYKVTRENIELSIQAESLLQNNNS